MPKPVVPALSAWMQEDEEFDIILYHMETLRPTWAMWDPVKKKGKEGTEAWNLSGKVAVIPTADTCMLHEAIKGGLGCFDYWLIAELIKYLS